MLSNAERFINPTIEVARLAGKKITEIYHSKFTVTQKADHSPVTDADLAANQIIIDGLMKFAPDIPTISEESDPVSFGTRTHWKQYWLIDPLDGTKEFIKHRDEFTVNIALIRNHTPILGIVQIPTQDICYFATQGAGAFKKTGDGMPVRIKTNKTDHANFSVIVGNHVTDSRTLDAFRREIGPHQISRVGSSLKTCLIAEGKADVYPRFGPTSEWDTAAAQCIIEEAGGKLTDMMLRPLRYNTKDSFLNPYFISFGNAKKDWANILKMILNS